MLKPLLHAAGLLVFVLLGACRERASGRSAQQHSPTSVTDSGIAVAPPDTTWPDPAPHRAKFASSSGTRIHYLDFGGRGEPLVLLTGLGSSAHIFDDLAPKFTDRFRVIYLDAFHDPVGLERIIPQDTIKVRATEVDLETYDKARAWFERCFYGFWSPALEADFRLNTTTNDPLDAILKDAYRNPAWRQDYSRIQVPTLVLYTMPTLERRRPCVAGLPDKARVRRAEAFMRDVWRPFHRQGIERLRRQMPQARLVELEGHHFLFISNQDQVVPEMRQFLGRR